MRLSSPALTCSCNHALGSLWMGSRTSSGLAASQGSSQHAPGEGPGDGDAHCYEISGIDVLFE